MAATIVNGFGSDFHGKQMRGHRTVILPAWQGLGLGPALSDVNASLWVATTLDGKRHYFMSTTTHPRFGAYRDDNLRWEPTSGNHKRSNEGTVQYSHDFVGSPYPFAPGVSRRMPMTGK